MSFLFEPGSEKEILRIVPIFENGVRTHRGNIEYKDGTIHEFDFPYDPNDLNKPPDFKNIETKIKETKHYKDHKLKWDKDK